MTNTSHDKRGDGVSYRCVHAGSTLLVDGRAYTIKDRHDDGLGGELVEMNECPGFLFGLWRFKDVPTSPEANSPEGGEG